MKVTGVYNIKGRGWTLEVICPLDQKLPEIGQTVYNEKAIVLGAVRGVEMFIKNITRGEQIGVVLGGTNKPECKEIFFK